MFARFDENPAMTLQDIKETKRYGWTDARTDGQRENSIPTTNKVCRGYKDFIFYSEIFYITKIIQPCLTCVVCILIILDVMSEITAMSKKVQRVTYA